MSSQTRATTHPGQRAEERAATTRSGAVVRAVAGLAAAFAIWWLATAIVADDGTLLARFAPVPAFGALAEFLTSSYGQLHVIVTLKRLAVGLTVAAGLGLPVGLAVASSRRLAEATGPVFQFVRMVSPLAWTPVAIILFGVGDAPVYFLVALAAVWPILLNTIAGVHALDPGWRLVARSLGASRWEFVRTILLPGIRGHVVTGLRVALGIAWVVIVPAEMLGVDSGLGYAILDARDRLSYDELMGIIVLIGALGFTLDAVAKALVRAGRRGTRSTTRPSGVPRPLEPVDGEVDEELQAAAT